MKAYLRQYCAKLNRFYILLQVTFFIWQQHIIALIDHSDLTYVHYSSTTENVKSKDSMENHTEEEGTHTWEMSFTFYKQWACAQTQTKLWDQFFF